MILSWHIAVVVIDLQVILKWKAVLNNSVNVVNNSVVISILPQYLLAMFS